MALNTFTEQKALLSWGRPYGGNVPNQDGVLRRSDQLQLLYLARDIPTRGMLSLTQGPMKAESGLPPWSGNF